MDIDDFGEILLKIFLPFVLLFEVFKMMKKDLTPSAEEDNDI